MHAPITVSHSLRKQGSGARETALLRDTAERLKGWG
jgi:hypothetical protein